MRHDPFPSTCQPALEELTTQLVRLVSERALALAYNHDQRANEGGAYISRKTFNDERIQSVAESIAKLAKASQWDFSSL